MDIKFSYLGYSLIFLLVWVILFYLRHDLRQRMLIFSLITMPLGPVSEFWFLRDYWRRPNITRYAISIEDAIFAFAIGGIAYSIYKVFFKMSVIESREPPRQAWLGIAFGIILILPLFVLTDLLRVNSIFSSTLSFLLITILTWILRPDLRKPSIISGVLVLILFFLIYKIMQLIFPGSLEYWCTGCNPTGIKISGLNIEELLWDFSWGLAGSIMYESVTSEKLQKL
jgi:hypothetical protein